MRRVSIKRYKRIIAGALSLFLTLGYPFQIADVLAEENAPDYVEEKGWQDTIDELLSAGEYIEGQVIVGIDYSVDIDDIDISTATDSEADFTASSELLQDSESIMEVSEDIVEEVTGEDVSDDISIEYIIDESRTTKEILGDLADDPRVVFAEPNYIEERESIDVPNVTKDLSALETTGTEQVADLTGYQWGFTSKTSTTVKDNASNPSMNVPGFGGTSANMTGDPIVVAVIDEPVDFSNPDLSAVAYTFTEEQQKTFGCDVHGYNATWQNTDGKQSSWAKAGHGTHCAGIIGASWDGKGISGVASNVRIISIQNCNSDGNTSIINDLKAFAFVKKCCNAGIPIRVTSNSYGLVQTSKALDSVVRDLGEKYGVVTVFAAGNSSKDNDVLMTAVNTLQDNPYAITVAATDERDKITNFSCYGRNSVTLGAPGNSVLSTVNMKSSVYLPDANIGNLVYEGFENDTKQATVKLINEESGSVIDTALVAGTDKPHFSGYHSAAIDVSKYPNATNKDTVLFTLEFDLGDISSQVNTSGDKYFAFTFHSSQPSYAYDSTLVNSSGNKMSLLGLEDNAYNNGNGWALYSCMIDDAADYSNFKIRVNMYLIPENTSDLDLYIDSIGIGTKTVPYGFMSGTSMACPAVAGAAAVIASQNKNIGADELVNIICSRVRSNDSLSNKTRTGGVLDLDGTAGFDLSPVITGVSLDKSDKKTLTISGKNFKDTAGSIVAVKDTAGISTIWDKNVLSGTVKSWSSDKVVYVLDKPFEGIMKLTLKTSTNKSYKDFIYFSKSSNVFEEELSIQKSMGDIYSYDAAGDYDTYGVLEGLNDKLYFIPSITKVEGTAAFKDMSCYDIAKDTWTELASLPEWLENISATTYDKKLVVIGDTMKVTNDVASSIMTPVKRIYVFDPSTNKWTKGSTSNVKGKVSIINVDNQLMLVGGKTAYKYSLTSGVGEKAYEWTEANFNYPRLAAKDGAIYVYDPKKIGMEVLKDGKATVIKYTSMPTFRTAYDPINENDTILGDSEYEDTRVREGVLLSVTDGVILLGPTDVNGTTDTYLLNTSSLTFTNYSKRLSDSKIMAVAATSYKGKIYAIGTTVMDPDERFFRATSISVDEKPGDSAVAPPSNNNGGGNGSGDSGNNNSGNDSNGNGNNNSGNDSNGNGNNNSGNDSNEIEKNNSGNSSNSNGTENVDNSSDVGGSNDSFGDVGNNYRNEWRNGQWYDSVGGTSYSPQGSWKCNSTGWWYEDTSGWYPAGCWQKIDGEWYYFHSDGYMASNEWVDGYWLSGSGAWSYEGIGSWRKNSKGWWYEDTFGWYAYSKWQKINGNWYYFNASGYMETNKKIDGYWIGSDGICQ